MTAILLLIGILSFTQAEFTAAHIGMYYGRRGDNLPIQQEVVDLYKSNGIGKIRIYNPDEGTLEALRGSNIEVILGVPNDQLQSLIDVGSATNWVNTYVWAYSQDIIFRYIAVGHEVDPGSNKSHYVLPVMQNIHDAISSVNLQSHIKVSTPIHTGLIGNSYPPNVGAFTDYAIQYIRPIINFLVNNKAPLLANVYPYYSYAGNPQSISLEYALFTQLVKNAAGYQNIFDAMLDSVYAALEKEGASNVSIVVSETGWPSKGGVGATVQNAGTYYQNLINHVKGGTIKRPNVPIETYLYTFDENQKPGDETERHYGLFRHNKSPKYHLSFN